MKLTRKVNGSLAVLLACWALAACKADGEEVPTDKNGQTGSIGAAECAEDTECLDMAEGFAEAFAEPEAAPAAFVESSCIQAGLSIDSGSYSGMTCECTDEDQRTFLVGPPGVPCLVSGRGGECLWTLDDLPDCDSQDADFCDTMCEQAEEHLTTRAKRSYETEVRLARCGEGNCEIVVRVGESCTTDGLRFHDCSLSDQEILEAARESYAVPVEGEPACDDYVPRDPNEWQGVRVESCREQICEKSEHCGLALACVDGGCGACFADTDCASGEVCVLDHCLLEDLVECKSYQDCGAGELCIFSLTGGTPRGNESTVAECIGSSGGSAD